MLFIKIDDLCNVKPITITIYSPFKKMTIDINRDILEHICECADIVTLGRLACVSWDASVICRKELATRIHGKQGDCITHHGSILRNAIKSNIPELLKFVLMSSHVKDRVGRVIESAIVCIHYNNHMLLSKLVKNFPAIIARNIWHIGALSTFPLQDETYVALCSVLEYVVNDEIKQEVSTYMYRMQQRIYQDSPLILLHGR